MMPFWNIEVCGTFHGQDAVIAGSTTGVEAATAVEALTLAQAKMDRGQEGWWARTEPRVVVYKIERFETAEAANRFPDWQEQYQLVHIKTNKPVA
ncbi:MAG TPA: hypothetical protein VGY48_15335 [Vicinamibacterales bacterium]|jgi:hypothetical protein|nr:hypothetical protein [Vicinamibacterales bacterium]